MTKEREALKLALVIDEFDGNDESLPLELLKPIAETLRALAQPPLPEQKPVACKHEWFRTGAMTVNECRCIKCGTWNTVAPTQRPWVGLTEADYCVSYSEEFKDGLSYAAEELKERNT